MNTRTIAKATFGVGFAVFVILGVMSILGSNIRPAVYPNEQRYFSAQIWLQRAQSVDDVFSAIGNPNTEEGVRIRNALNLVNTIDFAFMLAYSSFIALLYYFFGMQLRNGICSRFIKVLVVVGMILAIIMLVGDFFENLQLFKLTKAASHLEVDINTIAKLMFFTRLKWFALSFACIGFSFLLLVASLENPFLYLLALLYSVAGFLVLLSFLISWFVPVHQIAVYLIAAGWFISTIQVGSFILKKQAD